MNSATINVLRRAIERYCLHFGRVGLFADVAWGQLEIEIEASARTGFYAAAVI
jgi:hypothetical protein